MLAIPHPSPLGPNVGADPAANEVALAAENKFLQRDRGNCLLAFDDSNGLIRGDNHLCLVSGSLGQMHAVEPSGPCFLYELVYRLFCGP